MIHSCDHTCFCFGQTSVRNSNSGYNGESRPEFWILSKIVCLITRIQCTLLQSHALKKWSPYELRIIRAASIFCIHKISSQCYKMKLYQHSWIYHSHLRFRLALWINGRNSYMNPRQRKRRRCWYVTVPIWKNTGEYDGNKKTPLHFWS